MTQNGDDIENDEFGDELRRAFHAMQASVSSEVDRPAVGDILYAPQRRLRRKAVSAGAVLGAGALLTVGGFAVAQSLGDPDEIADDPPVVENTETESIIGEPVVPADETAPPEQSPSPSPSLEADPEKEQVVETITFRDWEQAECTGGAFPYDPGERSLAVAEDEEAPWSVRGAEVLDATGDGEDDLLVTVTCSGRTALGLFTDSDSPVQRAWIWRGGTSAALEEVGQTEDGHLTVAVTDEGEEATHVLAWDGERFEKVEDEQPPSPDPSDSVEPSESQKETGDTEGDQED
ncbi:hypothetical protein [Salininema proteolyticum]|uniref:Uncharacterized protein n=1 Tax=Salininema proteolyticum TaxID=1607685 RepID=A0ABV8TY30_9ACTN